MLVKPGFEHQQPNSRAPHSTLTLRTDTESRGGTRWPDISILQYWPFCRRDKNSHRGELTEGGTGRESGPHRPGFEAQFCHFNKTCAKFFVSQKQPAKWLGTQVLGSAAWDQILAMLSTQPREAHLNYLCLSFLNCQRGSQQHPFIGVLGRSNELIQAKCLE